MTYYRPQIAAVALFVLLGAVSVQERVALAQSDAASAILGKVLATLDAGSYTYLQLGTSKGSVWVALPRVKLKKGQEVAVQNGMVMKKFTSKILKLTFESIIFSVGFSGKHAATPTQADDNIAATTLTDIKVAKAKGDNAYTISEIFQKRTQLTDKKIKVHAKVVKVSMMIMGKNWMHLQDGTGNVAAKNHDLVVTTHSKPKKGSVVTVEGTLHMDKDFGAGYHYDAIIEDAEIK